MNFVKVGRLHPGGFFALLVAFLSFQKRGKTKRQKKRPTKILKKFSFYITNSKKNFKSFCQTFLKIFLFLKNQKYFSIPFVSSKGQNYPLMKF
jgi:hypothetical protein